MVKRVGCFVYSRGEFHDRLAQCAINSFKKWHPDVPVYGYEDIEVSKLSLPDGIDPQEAYDTPSYGWLVKNGGALQIAKTHSLDKIIILGADTITCSRLDEFLGIDSADVLGSLDYAYPLVTPAYSGCPFCRLGDDMKIHYVGANLKPKDKCEHIRMGNPHLNADVVCFNSMEALATVVERSPLHGHLKEQGALNEICFSKNFDYSLGIIDFPVSGVKNPIYNVQSKGNPVPPHLAPGSSAHRAWDYYMSKWYVKSNKLFNWQDRQIKVFHYCEGFGAFENEDSRDGRMNYFINECFNKETKEFYRDECDCGDFFEKEFSL